MNLEKLTIFNVNAVGVYMFTNDKFTLVPKGVADSVKAEVAKTLLTEVIEATISDTALLGVMIAGNNKGLLLPYNIRDTEIETVKKLDIPYGIVKSKANALGNIILANDRAVLIYERMEEENLKIIKDVLGVEEIRIGKIANMLTVGSVGVVTNKGGLVHVDVTEEELTQLNTLFKVKIDVGTVNFGNTFIRSGLVANSKGIIVGNATTGPEIVRIQKALGE
ncbi:translation initiation factor IF-6 [Sulfolobales archaeon HS-7]|nr:translation initiation factor IF-6 [Sulfolobales archaeon HS-7]